MEYDSDGDEVVVTDPSADASVAAIQALDGQQRTVVSLFRGPGRLDVGGNAAGPMMVYHCDDHAARRARWSHLTTPEAPDAELAASLAGDVGHFRGWQTTTVEPAKQAATEFLRSGGRADGLSWRMGDDVTDLRPPALDRD